MRFNFHDFATSSLLGEVLYVAIFERQITPRKFCTPFVKILLFYLKIPKSPFVLGKISYAIFKSELLLGNFIVEGFYLDDAPAYQSNFSFRGLDSFQFLQDISNLAS